jgi:hypothetical protein
MLSPVRRDYPTVTTEDRGEVLFGLRGEQVRLRR